MYSQPLLIAALLWAAHALPTEEQAGIVRFPLKRVPHSAATVERRQDTVPIPNSDVFAYLLAGIIYFHNYLSFHSSRLLSTDEGQLCSQDRYTWC